MLGYPFSATETANKHPNLTGCSEEWIYSCVLSRKQTIRGFKAALQQQTRLGAELGLYAFCLLSLADLVNPA